MPEQPSIPPAVVFDGVSFAFDDNVVLRNVSLTIPAGSMAILLGASGAGKSVLLKLILGLFRPDSGAIFVNGERVDAMSEHELMRIRGDIGMLFQESALFDSLTVAENVGYRLYEETDMPLDEVRRACRRGPRVHRPRRVHRPDAVANCPAASGAASRSRGRWPRSRSCCCSTIRRPASIRLRRDGRRRDRQAARPRARDVDRGHAPDPRRVLRREPRGVAAERDVEISADTHAAAQRAQFMVLHEGRIYFEGSGGRTARVERRLPEGVPLHDPAALVVAAVRPAERS